MTRTILVPVDGSAHADAAVALAADLAARHDARLCLFHVLLTGDVPESLRRLSRRRDGAATPDPALVPAGGYVPPGPSRALRVDIAEALLGRARRLAEGRGARRIESAWGEGPVTRRIVERAQDEQADTIVMGSRGLSDLAGLALGSISHQVAHRFGGSVVLVRQGSTGPSPAGATADLDQDDAPAPP